MDNNIVITKPRTSPKDFFLHLGALVTLYISATSLLALLFSTIDSLYPDALNYYSDPYSSGIRLAIASLIVIFPIYILLSWLLARDLTKVPEKRELGVRKWLGYFTLFVSGLTMMIDLVTLLNTFLNGEITVRFVLKVVSVLVVAGVIFAYYIYDVRRDWSKGNKGLKIFAILACVGVVASVVGGFLIMGSPTTARTMHFDEQRVSDLQSIQWQIVNYWQAKNELPVALADLNDPISNFAVPKDPSTGVAYEYTKTGAMTFNLCATFGAGNKLSGGYKTVPTPVGSVNETWNHTSGKVCFDRTIDPKLYPPRVK